VSRQRVVLKSGTVGDDLKVTSEQFFHRLSRHEAWFWLARSELTG